jgi:glycosyltransferase involved in cell wall biosynthesis
VTHTVADSETVTLGVPAYRGADLIAETLAAVQAQTHANLRVAISIDGPDPATEEACRPFLADRRFSLVVQPRNLGWVGNFNWLVDRADTTFWCYMQQDDLISPTYLEALVTTARAHPHAAVVYSDMETFGERVQPVTMPSVGGSSSGRQLALIHDHFAAVALRGICRETLYRKRFHATNVHTAWARWPEEQRAHAWVVHCTEMLDEAMACEADVDERRLLYDATITRLVTARRAPEYLTGTFRTAEGRHRLVEEFVARLRAVGRPDLPQLLEWDWDAFVR